MFYLILQFTKKNASEKMIIRGNLFKEKFTVCNNGPSYILSLFIHVSNIGSLGVTFMDSKSAGRLKH